MIHQPVRLLGCQDAAVPDPARAFTGGMLLEDPPVQTPPVEALRDPRGEQPAGAIESEDLFLVPCAGDGQRLVFDGDAVGFGSHGDAIVPCAADADNPTAARLLR